MTIINKIESRPSKDLIEQLKDIGTATVAGSLGHMGFRSPHMVGPVSQYPGKSIVGPGADTAVPAAAARPLQRGRVFRSGDPAPPPRPLPGGGGRRGRRRCARRHDLGRLRRHDVDLLQGPRRRRHRHRRRDARQAQHQQARHCGLAPGLDAELSRPDRHLPECGERADLVRRRDGHSRRHHHGRRRWRRRPAGVDGAPR